MRIDRQRLQQCVAHYLNHPASERVFLYLQADVLVCLGVSLFSFCGGLILLATILGTLAGLRMIWYGLTLRNLVNDPGWQLRGHKERIQPLIAPGIIIGPSGHALLLGTFDPRAQDQIDWLCTVALELSGLYKHGAVSDVDQPLVELLRNDQFQEYRRRKLPEPRAAGMDLLLFDIHVDQSIVGFAGDGYPVFACLATAGDEGGIIQIPWEVIAPAVQ